MVMGALGKILIRLGILLLAVGLFLYFAPNLSQIPGLKYLGRLPGDIAIKRENFRFYFPLGTSLLISLILTLIFFLLGLFRR